VSTHLQQTAPTAPPVTFVGLVRSEWLKLLSLRAATIPLLLAAVVIVALGLAVTAGLVADREPLPAGAPVADVARASAAAFDRPLAGVLLAQLLVAAVGASVVTSEFATGMIRTTVLVAQRRGLLMAAKALVVAVAVTVVCGLAVVVAFTIGTVLLARVGLNSSFTDPGVLAALTATIATLTGTALLGLAAGTLLRSGAAAICTVLGAFFVVPLLLPLLPTDGAGGLVQRWWVSQTTVNAVDVVHHNGALPAPAGALAFAAWIVLVGTAALAAFRRRDV